MREITSTRYAKNIIGPILGIAKSPSNIGQWLNFFSKNNDIPCNHTNLSFLNSINFKTDVPVYLKNAFYHIDIKASHISSGKIQGNLLINGDNKVLVNHFKSYPLVSNNQNYLYQFIPDDNGSCFYFPYWSFRTFVHNKKNLFMNQAGLGCCIVPKESITNEMIFFTQGLGGCSVYVLRNKISQDLIFIHDDNGKYLVQYMLLDPEKFNAEFEILHMLNYASSLEAFDCYTNSTISTHILIEQKREHYSKILGHKCPVIPSTNVYFMYNERKKSFSQLLSTSIATIINHKSSLFSSDQLHHTILEAHSLFTPDLFEISS